MNGATNEPMKTAEWHQQGRSGDFIVNLKKKYTFYYFT